MAASLVLWAIVTLCSLCAAVPTISYPLNSQVPPVARVGRPFSFVFSPSTFTSPETLSYEVRNGPAWLTVDSATRRLYGTPGDADVTGDLAGAHFDLVAIDGTGSVTLSATVVVSRNPPLSVNVPLAKQVPDFGTFSQPSSILTTPGTAFTLKFASDTFSDPSGKGLTYYAVMGDNTPLPSWVSFDASSLSFTGTTPPWDPSVQTPRVIPLQLLASDVAGFSAASLPFSIVIGKHAFTADSSLIVLSAMSGTRMSYTRLKSQVKVDGQPAAPGNVLVVATPEIPSWVSMDHNTWEISGTPPDSAKSTNFTVMLQDTFSDTLNLTVSLNVTNGVFKGTLPELKLTAGQRFKLDLTSHLSNPSDTTVWVDVTPRSTWVHFDATRNVLSGQVPDTLNTPSIAIEVHAKSKSSGLELSQDLPVRIRTATLEIAHSASRSTTTPTSTPSSSADPITGAHPMAPLKDILMAILIPTMILLLVLACLYYCHVRRRRREDGLTSTGSIKRTVSDARDRAKDSFQSLIHHSLSHTSMTNRRSQQKSYAQAAIGNLKKFKPDHGAFPTLLSPRIPRSDSMAPPSDDAPLEPTKESWWAAVSRKVFRKRPSEGYLPRTSLNDEKQKGVALGASHHEHPLTHHDNDSATNLQDCILEGDEIQALDMTSAQSAPNFDYSGKPNSGPGSEPHRATTFGEFTTAASNPGAPSSPQPELAQENQTPPPLVKRLTSMQWGAGGVTRFVSNIRKKKESTTASILPVNISAPSPLIHPQPVLGERPLARRAMDLESSAGLGGESGGNRAGPPNRAVSTSALPRSMVSGLAQKAVRKKASRDSLGVPYDCHVAGPPPSFPSDTWSTLPSESLHERGGTIPEHEGRGSLDTKAKVTSFPMDVSCASTNMSLGSQPNWTVIRDSPPPSVWRTVGGTSTMTGGNGGRWPQRPRTACEPLDNMSETSSHYGTRPPSRRRDWMGAGGGSKLSRVSSSRVGPGPAAYSVASLAGTTQGGTAGGMG